MLPNVSSPADLHAALRDEALWPSVARAIAERHGLPRGSYTRTAGSFPVLLDEQRVIKLVPRRWRHKMEAEACMLAHLSRRLPVRTPDIVAMGELEGWDYLVMTRLEGRVASEVFSTATPDAQRKVMRAVGELLAAVHDLPGTDLAALERDWPSFVEERRSECMARHANGGADPAWVAAIPSWLDPLLSELRAAPRLVAMSADVHADNLLVTADLALAGFFDFGDALMADPAYDFVTPAVFLARGQAELIQAMLAGYGVAPTPEMTRRCRALEVLHRYSDLRRDAALLLPPRALAKLEDVLAAIWPL